MSPTIVQDGLVVSIAYTLTLDDGQMVDQSSPGEPLVYLHGAQNILPGLEKALTGMAMQERRQVLVSPGEGYGEYDEDALEIVDRAMFPANLNLHVGMALAMRDEDDNRFNVLVSELDDDEVTLDFNHPLAGETLHFDVQVVALREATPDEHTHGHPHSPDGHGH